MGRRTEILIQAAEYAANSRNSFPAGKAVADWYISHKNNNNGCEPSTTILLHMIAELVERTATALGN